MKKIYLLPVFFVSLLFLYIFRSPLLAAGENIVYYSPCDHPISYSIGEIDSRFEVTKDELVTDAKTAANIWNNTQGKQLFVYDPASTFTINMVYDTRQELTSKINDLDSNLKEKQNQIDPKIEDYKKRQADFEARMNKLNEEIKYWNSQGGAPKETYDRLINDQMTLRNEAARLNEEAKELGHEATEYNVNASELNKTIDDYQEVLNYKPEEGLYEQEGNKRKISIFIDVDKEEFLHTLTHEFGHALGLSHINDPEAIMYPQTTSELTPHPSEIAQLSEICKKRTVFEVGLIRMQEIARVISSRIQKKTTLQ